MSGRIRSTPRCSSRGNARPASTITISPSSSKTVMFLPTSPRPPSGMILRARSGIGEVKTGRLPTLQETRPHADGTTVRATASVVLAAVLGVLVVAASVFTIPAAGGVVVAFLAAVVGAELLAAARDDDLGDPV